MKLFVSFITLLLSSSTTLADKSAAAYGTYDTCHYYCYSDLRLTNKTDKVLLCLVGCIDNLKRSPEVSSSPGPSRVDALVSQATPLLVQACHHTCHGNPAIHSDTNALLECLKPCDEIEALNHLKPIDNAVPNNQVVPVSMPEASATNVNPGVNQTILHTQVPTVDTIQPILETKLPAADSVQPASESYIPDVKTTQSIPGTQSPSNDGSNPIPDSCIPTVGDVQVTAEPSKPVCQRTKKCHKHKPSASQHA